jgi:Ca2+-binding EF-hand superfamily protein
MKALRKVLAIDLPKAKEYLQNFARLDSARKGELTYDEFRKFFEKDDTPELQNLFALLDTEDRGAIRFRQFLCGMAILNEQVMQLELCNALIDVCIRLYHSLVNGP